MLKSYSVHSSNGTHQEAIWIRIATKNAKSANECLHSVVVFVFFVAILTVGLAPDANWRDDSSLIPNPTIQLEPPMRTLQHTLFLASAVLALTLTLTLIGAAQDANQLTAKEKAQGWKLLFDGKTTKGWRGFHREGFPATGWAIENGTIKHL